MLVLMLLSVVLFIDTRTAVAVAVVVSREEDGIDNVAGNDTGCNGTGNGTDISDEIGTSRVIAVGGVMLVLVLAIVLMLLLLLLLE